MRTHFDDEANRLAVAEMQREESEGGAADIAQEQEARPGEELRVLLICVATGVTVGFVFLLYIISSAAHLLP